MQKTVTMTAGLLGVVFAISRGVAAEPAAGEVDLLTQVDLARLTSYARVNNPEIQAMEQRWRAVQARAAQEGALPDPLLNTAYHNEGFDRLQQGRSDFAWLRFGVEQELPFPGKLALKHAGAERAAQREEALYRQAVLGVLARVRMAYDDYFLAHKSIEIVDGNKALLRKLTEAAEARYEVGEGLQQDVVRAEVEISTLVGRLISLEQEQQSAAAMLNALLNRPPAAALGAPALVEKPSFTASLEQLERLAREQAPSLQAAELAVARAETGFALARREYYPDFIVRADYLNKAGLTPEWEVGAGVRVPLYFWRKQAVGVQEATAAANEARAIRQNTGQDVLAKLKDLHAQATGAARLVELYGNAVVPQAEVSLSSASAGYQVGKVDFITLLNSFTVLNEYQLRYYEELAKLDKAVARIEEVVGPLPADERVGDPR